MTSLELAVLTFAMAWITMSIIIGLCARYKGRSMLLYTALSLVFTPVLVGLVLKRLEDRPKITDMKNEIARPKVVTDKRFCKDCGKELKPGYSICHHCFCVNIIPEE